MNGRPPKDKPPIGRLLPRRDRQPSIPGKEITDAGFMQNSAKPVTVLGEPTRCPLTLKLPVLSDAVLQRANTAAPSRKLPPLPGTLNFLSPKCPVKLAKEDIRMVASINNSSIAGASVGRPKRMMPLKTINKKDDLLVKGSRKAAQRSTELIKNDKKAKTHANNVLPPPALIASNQDVCTQKPQPPSKPVVRKTIGQRLRTKKTAEVAATALHDLNVEVFVKTPNANIAEDLDHVEQAINTTATNGCGTVSADVSGKGVATRSCGDMMATRIENADLTSVNDPLVHHETTAAVDRVLETPQEVTAVAVRTTSSSKLEEIRARRKARRQTEKTPLLQPGPSRSKLPTSRVSHSPELQLILEVDECSSPSSKASSPGKSEERPLTVIQPHPPVGPRPPRRSNKTLRRPRSQARIHRS